MATIKDDPLDFHYCDCESCREERAQISLRPFVALGIVALLAIAAVATLFVRVF